MNNSLKSLKARSLKLKKSKKSKKSKKTKKNIRKMKGGNPQLSNHELYPILDKEKYFLGLYILNNDLLDIISNKFVEIISNVEDKTQEDYEDLKYTLLNVNDGYNGNMLDDAKRWHILQCKECKNTVNFNSIIETAIKGGGDAPTISLKIIHTPTCSVPIQIKTQLTEKYRQDEQNMFGNVTNH